MNWADGGAGMFVYPSCHMWYAAWSDTPSHLAYFGSDLFRFDSLRLVFVAVAALVSFLWLLRFGAFFEEKLLFDAKNLAL